MPDDDLPEDERPNGEKAAKEKAAKLLKDPKYERPHGHPDDERTRDDDMKKEK